LPKLLVIFPLQPFSLVEEVVVDVLPATVPVLLIFPEEIWDLRDFSCFSSKLNLYL